MDDASFRQILEFFNLSWQGYRRVRKGVKKRMARHMEACGCRRMEDYLGFLSTHPKALQKARQLLTVSISRFFRDIRLWEILEQCVIPRLVERAAFSGRGTVQSWSAGCSCGEEVYSLKLLWHHLGQKSPPMPPLEIRATDSNPEVLEKARAAVYPASSLKNLPPALLEEAFIPRGPHSVLREGFKEGVHWQLHDFITQPPPQPWFDLILVRNNLLTYYEPPLRTQSFLQILEALRPGGFLITGRNEEIPVEASSLQSCPKYRWIYEKLSPSPG